MPLSHILSIRMIVFLVLLLSSPAAADGEPIDSSLWNSWAEIGAIGSTELHRGEFTFFVPRGNDSTLGFLDLRAKIFSDFDDEDGFEGNFAVGARHMLSTPLLGQAWNIGGWGGADVSHSRSDNVFWQFSSGLELLSADWDLRFNGYVPITKKKSANQDEVDFDFSGSRALMEGAVEVPLYGFDGEVGWRIPLERVAPDTGWFQSADQTARIAVGGFHFEHDDAGAKVSGPRLRGEWSFFNWLPGASGAELRLEVEYQWDDVRDEQWSGGLRFRLPIGGSSHSQTHAASNVASLIDQEVRRRRRMTERVVRDVDIVVGGSPRERVELVANGRKLGRVVTVSSNTSDPEGAIESAGENGLVLFRNNDFRILVDRAIVLSPGQVLLGSGAELKIRGTESNVEALFRAPGVPGESDISGRVPGDTTGLIVAADDVLIRGLTLSNSQGNTVSLFRNRGVVLDDVVLSSVSDATVLSRGGSIDPAFEDEFKIRDSLISGSSGISVATQGNARFTIDNTNLLNGESGLSLEGNFEARVNNVLIANYIADGHGIILDGSGTLEINDSRVRVRGDNAHAVHQLSATSELTINNSQLETTNGSDEVVFATAGALTINNSTISSTNTFAHGVSVRGGSQFSMNGGSITTTGANSDGVRFTTVAGDTGNFALDGVTVRSTGHGVLFDGDTFGTGSVESTLRNNDLRGGDGVGPKEIAAVADGSSSIHLSIFGNELDSGLGLVQLNELAGAIRVVQDAPGSGASGVDVLNGIPSLQVEIPGNTIDFNEPLP